MTDAADPQQLAAIDQALEEGLTRLRVPQLLELPAEARTQLAAGFDATLEPLRQQIDERWQHLLVDARDTNSQGAQTPPATRRERERQLFAAALLNILPLARKLNEAEELVVRLRTPQRLQVALPPAIALETGMQAAGVGKWTQALYAWANVGDPVMIEPQVQARRQQLAEELLQQAQAASDQIPELEDPQLRTEARATVQTKALDVVHRLGVETQRERAQWNALELDAILDLHAPGAAQATAASAPPRGARFGGRAQRLILAGGLGVLLLGGGAWAVSRGVVGAAFGPGRTAVVGNATPSTVPTPGRQPTATAQIVVAAASATTAVPPTIEPTTPTAVPPSSTSVPTTSPTDEPITSPTDEPTTSPTDELTATPTTPPTATAEATPTAPPTATAEPTSTTAASPSPTTSTASTARGRIAWTANRDDNDEIYTMLPNGKQLTNVSQNPADDYAPAWSPDGTRIAFLSKRDGGDDPQLYVMNADGSRQTRLTNVPGFKAVPTWSPDGKQLALGFKDDIYVLNADGSRLRPVVHNPEGDLDPTWSPDGQYLVFASFLSGNYELYRTNLDTNETTRLTDSSGPDLGPRYSPDGTQIAFVSARAGKQAVYIMQADGSEVRRITRNTPDVQSVAWSPDGTQLVFDAFEPGSHLYRVNADGSDLTQLTADATFDGEPAWGVGAAAGTAAGSELVFSTDRDGNQEIYRVNRDGSDPVNLTNNPARDYMPQASPDGTRLAWGSDRDGNTELYVMDINGGDPLRLTNSRADEYDPAWSPDGQRIAFVRSNDVFLINPDGSGEIKVTRYNGPDYQPSWSSDGQHLAYASYRNGNLDIYLTNLDGSELMRLTDDPGEDLAPTWSPDGYSLAFVSNRGDNLELYLMNSDGSGQTRLSKNMHNVTNLAWSPDSRHILFDGIKDNDEHSRVFRINIDGSGQMALTDGTANDLEPSWVKP